MATDTALVIFAYLMGSLSSAVIACRLAGLPDPRSEGSRNPGATNVLRYGGRKLAAAVLCGDTLKGLIPVLAAQALAESPTAVALTGLAAFSGHLYPLFFGFRGGKGVATSLGVILGLSWIIGGLLIALWLAVAWAFRISSLAALGAALAAPFVTWFVLPVPAYVGAVTAMSILLAWRHRSNIKKLLRNQEPRIGTK